MTDLYRHNKPTKHKLGEVMIDLRGPNDVEVEHMGNRLYVHVDGVTVLRIYEANTVRFTKRDQ